MALYKCVYYYYRESLTDLLHSRSLLHRPHSRVKSSRLRSVTVCSFAYRPTDRLVPYPIVIIDRQYYCCNQGRKSPRGTRGMSPPDESTNESMNRTWLAWSALICSMLPQYLLWPCVSVCPSVRPSQAGIVPKWLNVYDHANNTAQLPRDIDAKAVGEIRMGVTLHQ